MTTKNCTHKLLSMLMGLGVVAILVAPVYAARVAHQFDTEEQLAIGTVVSIDGQADRAILASTNNLTNMYGVVVSSGDVSFEHSGNEESVSVASEGVVDVLVSTNKGEIAAGDPITVSDLAGIAKKATSSGQILGYAQRAFAGTEVDTKEVSVGTSENQRKVRLGVVPVKIEVTQYVAGDDLARNNEGDRNRLLRIADDITGKSVNGYAFAAAVLVILLSIFIATFLITSSSYASMISMGRNPLQERNILRSLLTIVGVAAGVFAVGLLFAYAILRIF